MFSISFQYLQRRLDTDDRGWEIKAKVVKHHTLLRQDTHISSAELQERRRMTWKRESHMAVTDSHTLLRLRSEECLAEQQGRQASNIAVILKNHPQYDAARQKADALLAKASALCEQIEQIVKIETS
jgi:hypothetical protein